MHRHCLPSPDARASDLHPDTQRRLAAGLITAAHALERPGHAVPEPDIAAYLALRWMQRRGRHLALTPMGRAVRDDALRAFVL
jgi:hypothetical protein